MAAVGLQPQAYTVNEASGPVTVCAELIDGEIERDIVASLSTLADGTAQGQQYLSELGWNSFQPCSLTPHSPRRFLQSSSWFQTDLPT